MSIYVTDESGVPRLKANIGTRVKSNGQSVPEFDADSKQDKLSETQTDNIDMLAVLMNPLTSQPDTLQNILYALGGIAPNRISASEFDSLGLTAGGFDAKGITAYDFDFRAKSVLTA